MEGEKAIGKSYDGPSGAGRDSQWLTWEDLPDGKDLVATIEDVQLFLDVKFEGGRTKDRMLGLKFKGGKRVLGLNATNRKTLVKMFGNLTGGWRSEKVALYVTQTQMAGETRNCVRIRDRGSKTAKAAAEFLTTTAAAGNNSTSDLGLDVGDEFEQAVATLDLTEAEAGAILTFHGDRAKAAAALVVQVREKFAAEA